MSIVDIRKAFTNASQGVLTLLECTMHPVLGPNGELEYQRLRFVCAHGGTQRRFVVNPHWEIDRFRNDFERLEVPACPPLGDLYETTKTSVRAVLEAVGDGKAFRDLPAPPAAYLG